MQQSNKTALEGMGGKETRLQALRKICKCQIKERKKVKAKMLKKNCQNFKLYMLLYVHKYLLFMSAHMYVCMCNM